MENSQKTIYVLSLKNDPCLFVEKTFNSQYELASFLKLEHQTIRKCFSVSKIIEVGCYVIEKVKMNYGTRLTERLMQRLDDLIVLKYEIYQECKRYVSKEYFNVLFNKFLLLSHGQKNVKAFLLKEFEKYFNFPYVLVHLKCYQSATSR